MFSLFLLAIVAIIDYVADFSFFPIGLIFLVLVAALFIFLQWLVSPAIVKHAAPHRALLPLPGDELLQPVSGKSTAQMWLESHGEGISHLAFIVDDIEEAKSTMVEAGFTLFTSMDNQGGGGSAGRTGAGDGAGLGWGFRFSTALRGLATACANTGSSVFRTLAATRRQPRRWGAGVSLHVAGGAGHPGEQENHDRTDQSLTHVGSSLMR
jgi:hypothetical protein